MNFTTKTLTACALFAALTAILAQISIPIGPVPINLAHVSVFLGASLLGAKRGALSQGVYILLGAFGVPVFSNFNGGFGVILGPTGGFIIGYLVCAFMTGLLVERWGTSSTSLGGAMGVGLFFSYVLGTAWFMFIMNADLITALTLCVFPFLLGDFLKITLSTTLVKRLEAHARFSTKALA